VEQIGVRFAENRGIDAGDPAALEQLRDLSPEQVRGELNMASLFGSGQRDFAGPFADGVTVVDPAAAYAYRFSYVAGSADRTAGAQHATDVPFFLNTEAVKYGDRSTAQDTGMGRIISRYVVDFARTGDPNGSGLPVWPRYSRADDMLMDFALSGEAEPKRDPLR
jgi:para-nitrobenzyl esterase